MKFTTDTVQMQTSTALGTVFLAANSRGLCGLWFERQKHLPSALDGTLNGPTAWPQDHTHPVLQAAAVQLQEYFAGTRRQFDLPLDLQAGTPFQQAVWRALIGIGYGQTSSYGALASHIGHPTAARAVGAAVGRNPLSIIVPCHRIMGTKGQLTGYAGGLGRKEALLRLERDATKSSNPS